MHAVHCTLLAGSVDLEQRGMQLIILHLEEAVFKQLAHLLFLTGRLNLAPWQCRRMHCLCYDQLVVQSQTICADAVPLIYA